MILGILWDFGDVAKSAFRTPDEILDMLLKDHEFRTMMIRKVKELKKAKSKG